MLRRDSGITGQRLASQTISAVANTQASQTPMWYPISRGTECPCVIMLIHTCSPLIVPKVVQKRTIPSQVRFDIGLSVPHQAVPQVPLQRNWLSLQRTGEATSR